MLEKAEALASEIVKMCVRRGGAITGEHGVGMEKRHLMTDMFSDQDINQMLKLIQKALLILARCFLQTGFLVYDVYE